MKEGYWCNYAWGRWFLIHEHEYWIRGDGNAQKLGLSSDLINVFDKFRPVRDRDLFLLFLMHHAPIMRVRGHGEHTSFEFACADPAVPLGQILGFLEQYAGPCTGVFVRDFANNKELSAQYQQLREWVEADGYGGLMQRAIKATVKASVSRELRRITAALRMPSAQPGQGIRHEGSSTRNMHLPNSASILARSLRL